MKPYWVYLLKHFEEKRYFQNGLTLPFIIAARKYIEPNEELFTIDKIVNEICSSSFYVNVFECNTIKEYVFNLSIQDDINCYTAIDKFVIIDDSFKKDKGIAGIILELECRGYSEKIQNGQFSINERIWGDFTPLEKDRLKEVKSLLNI